jgi:hypothetical protein
MPVASDEPVGPRRQRGQRRDFERDAGHRPSTADGAEARRDRPVTAEALALPRDPPHSAGELIPSEIRLAGM